MAGAGEGHGHEVRRGEPLSAAEDDTAPPLELRRFLPYRLSVTTESISRAFAASYERRFGIGIPEWRVLAVLGEASPRPTQAIIEQTEMDPVKVSRAAARLVEKGLVARRVRPEDGRSHSLSLTPRGRATYRQIVPLAQALQAQLTAALSTEELNVLDRALAALHVRAHGLGDDTR